MLYLLLSALVILVPALGLWCATQALDRAETRFHEIAALLEASFFLAWYVLYVVFYIVVFVEFFPLVPGV